MSTPLTPYPIRLFCDLATPSLLLDLNRGVTPFFYRGDDIEIDIGIGQDGALLAPTIASSGASGIAGVTAQIFLSENDTSPPMMACTVLADAMNLALTSTEWLNDTTPFCHAAFIFPSAQTAITLNGAASVTYWLRITAQTTDATAKTITLLDGPITVKDGPVSTASPPSAGSFRLYSVDGSIVPQLLDTTTGLYHTLAILNSDGELSIQLSDTGY
jgi:hypothetical protein